MYLVNFTEKMSVNLTHAHTVCTRPSLSQREGPGDEAKVEPPLLKSLRMGLEIKANFITCCLPAIISSKSKSIIIEERKINTFVMIFTNLRAQFVPLYTTAMAIHCVCMQSHSHVNVYLNSVNYES